jgi:hypothetical protein
MVQIARALDALLVPLLSVAAIVTGFYVPLWLFGNRPGFLYGMVLSCILTLLGSVMGAYLFGSWGEQYLGSRWGVPLGTALGGLVTSIVLNLATGFIGNLIYMMFHR